VPIVGERIARTARTSRGSVSLVRLASAVLFAALVSSSCAARERAASHGAAAQSFEVHGHRGSRGLRPESTLSGFEAAIELGVDRVELDLHLSADDELIVWHDSAITPQRCRYGAALATSDVLFSGRPAIRSLTREQLRAFECDVLQPEFATQRAIRARFTDRSFAVVTLGEVFAFVEGLARDERAPTALRERASRVGFNVELKRGWPGDRAADSLFERAVLRVIEAHHMRERVVVQSFDEATLRAVRALDARVALSLLANELLPLDRVRVTGATVLSPSADIVTSAYVREAHRAGLRVIVWTVNDASALRAQREMGVDGVITDRPDVVLRALGR
jgi:glycerophosphoryl diester phosphodiesterase